MYFFGDFFTVVTMNCGPQRSEHHAKHHNKIQKKISFSRFLPKTLRVNKIAMKSFSNICRSESTLKL